MTPNGLIRQKKLRGIERWERGQLLAAFPPESCFLAELDGRTVLVFRDAALRDEFLR